MVRIKRDISVGTVFPLFLSKQEDLVEIVTCSSVSPTTLSSNSVMSNY